MMIKCYECSADVSDLAAVCPRCGAPLGKNSSQMYKYKDFVDDIFQKLCKTRSEYGDDVVEKILLIPKEIGLLWKRSALSSAIRWGMLRCYSKNTGELDYSRFFWDGIYAHDRDVIIETINKSIFNYMANHQSALKADPFGCKDLLIDMSVCEYWSRATTLDKCLKEFDGIRKYIDELHSKGLDNVDKLHEKLLLMCDNFAAQKQFEIISRLRALYDEKSRRCVVCGREVDDSKYYYRYDIEKYAPAETGRVRFIIDEPRCKECADRHEEELKYLKGEYKRVWKMQREMENAKWVFHRKEKLAALEVERKGIDDKLKHCGEEYSRYVVASELEANFPSKEELKQVGHLWRNIVPLRQTYVFSVSNKVGGKVEPA